MLLNRNNLINQLTSHLNASSRIDVAVAWARECPALDRLCKFAQTPGKSLRVIVGLSGNCTDPTALDRLHRCGQLRIFETRTLAGGIFHPKFYLFHQENKKIAWIGSSNLTAGGFIRNDELGVAFVDKGSAQEWFNRLWNSLQQNAQQLQQIIAGYKAQYNNNPPPPWLEPEPPEPPAAPGPAEPPPQPVGPVAATPVPNRPAALGGANQLNRAYWRAFGAYLTTQGKPNPFRDGNTDRHFRQFPIGHGCSIVASISTRKKHICVGLDTPMRTTFDTLNAQRHTIEEKFRFPLMWRQAQRGQRTSHIELYRHNVDPSDPHQYADLHPWMLKNIIQFKEVFGPLI